jgi:hypothetical protein
MSFLAVLFIPPLYFATRKRWGAFVINSVFYGTACLLALSLIFILFAPLFWLVAFFHASWYFRQERVVAQAELLATKMAEKMRDVQKSA